MHEGIDTIIDNRRLKGLGFSTLDREKTYDTLWDCHKNRVMQNYRNYQENKKLHKTEQVGQYTKTDERIIREQLHDVYERKCFKMYRKFTEKTNIKKLKARWVFCIEMTQLREELIQTPDEISKMRANIQERNLGNVVEDLCEQRTK